MKIKNKIILVFLTLIMTFMEMTGIPSAFFFNIKILDINPIYFTLMLNFLIAFILCWLTKKYLITHWYFGLTFNGAWSGLKRYGFPALIATIIVTIAFCIGLSPFDNKPSMWRVVIEGIVYYIGVSIMEELYLRGLLQNIIEKYFGERKHSALYSVIIASLLFGFGHIFGAIGQPVYTIIAKTIWATALGVYFGAIYIMTRNLWVPIILHFVVDLVGIPFCFSTANEYPQIALVVCLICYTALGVYGIKILKR